MGTEIAGGQGDGAGKEKPGLGIATHWTLHKSTRCTSIFSQEHPSAGYAGPRPRAFHHSSSVRHPRPLPTRFYQKEGTPEEESETRFLPFPLFLFTFTPSVLLSPLPSLSLLIPVSPSPSSTPAFSASSRGRNPQPPHSLGFGGPLPPASHPLRASPPPAPPLRPRPRPQPISALPPTAPPPGLSGRAPRSPGLDAEGGAAGRGPMGSGGRGAPARGSPARGSAGL